MFTAYSTPLFWMVNASPEFERIYAPYVRFVFDLFDVSFGRLTAPLDG